MSKKYHEPRPSIPAEAQQEVRVEAGHRCGISLCTEIVYQIHHIDGNRENNDPRNLIPLCGGHHYRAHLPSGSMKITREELRAYKDRLARAANPSVQPTFIRSDEARRVAKFTSCVRAALTWHDGESLQSIDNQLGYWFPKQVYDSLCEILDDRRGYEVDARSFDPEAFGHQDMIMSLIGSLVADIRGPHYVDIGYCYNYRPGQKSDPGYHEKVERQTAHINGLALQLVNKLNDLDAYVTRRP